MKGRMKMKQLTQPTAYQKCRQLAHRSTHQSCLRRHLSSEPCATSALTTKPFLAFSTYSCPRSFTVYPFFCRIKSKFLCLAFKALSDLNLTYLSRFISHYSPSRVLYWSQTGLLTAERQAHSKQPPLVMPQASLLTFST